MPPPPAEEIPQDVSQERTCHRQPQGRRKMHVSDAGRHSHGDEDRGCRQRQTALLEQGSAEHYDVSVLMQEGSDGAHRHDYFSWGSGTVLMLPWAVLEYIHPATFRA